MSSLYVLALRGGKYYVGKTRSLERRMQQHVDGQGSAWTKKYPPVRVEKTMKNIDDFDEDKWVKIYMNQYGIANVRGGTYSNIQLTPTQQATLQAEIWASTDRCLRCGRDTHFVKNCSETHDVNGAIIGVAVAVAAAIVAEEEEVEEEETIPSANPFDTDETGPSEERNDVSISLYNNVRENPRVLTRITTSLRTFCQRNLPSFWDLLTPPYSYPPKN